MQGHDAVAAAGEPHLARHVRRLDRGADQLEAVDHDVADAADPGLGHALGKQVLVGVGRRRPQHVREDVGDEPVHLLRHRPVAAPETGLEMDDGNAELRPDQGTGGGRIDVADGNEPVGPVA